MTRSDHFTIHTSAHTPTENKTQPHKNRACVEHAPLILSLSFISSIYLVICLWQTHAYTDNVWHSHSIWKRAVVSISECDGIVIVWVRVWFFLAINHSPFVLFVQCVYVRTAYVCLLDLYGFVHTYSGNTQQKISLFHTLTTISFRRYVCVCVCSALSTHNHSCTQIVRPTHYCERAQKAYMSIFKMCSFLFTDSTCSIHTRY